MWTLWNAITRWSRCQLSSSLATLNRRRSDNKAEDKLFSTFHVTVFE